MKLFLLKIILQRRTKDEGFTLPMVIAIGLILILLGAVNITTANEENLNAITQNSRSDALAIAEVGVARYRELLDKNRILAINDSDQWASLAEVCDMAIASSFTSGTLNSSSNNISIAEDGLDLNNDGDTNDTFSNQFDSFPTGSYSLISYDYSNANGTFNLTDDSANNNARGILTVRGTTPDNNGQAQIQVEIPLYINKEDMNNLAPALWINDNTITAADLGNLTVSNGNVVIRDQAVTTSGSEVDGCSDFSTLATATGLPILSDARDIPLINTVIDDVTNASIVSAGDQTNAIPTVATPPGSNRLILGTRNQNAYNPAIDPTTFDPDNDSGDCKEIKLCRYYYDPISLNITDTDLLTDGVAKTTILVSGAVSINATTQDVNIGSTSNLSSSDGFEIYVNGNNNITINADSGRTVTIDAFIHAPNSTLTINGTGTVNINGSVWVDDFVNSSATVNISPDQSSISSTVSDRAYEFYTTTANRTAKPLTGSPTNWKTEEAN